MILEVQKVLLGIAIGIAGNEKPKLIQRRKHLIVQDSDKVAQGAMTDNIHFLLLSKSLDALGFSSSG